MPNYQAPDFLKGKTTQQIYTRWLNRKANAHFKRDRKHSGSEFTRQEYKEAIHKAVLKSKGIDSYTGSPLKWELISRFDNTEAKLGKRKYMVKFAQLPTVDHVDRGHKKLNFNICSWKINDSKSYMTLKEFIDLAKDIIKFNKNKVL